MNASTPPTSNQRLLPSQSRVDPIRKNYYDIIEKLDKWSDYLAYLAATLSIAMLLVTKKNHLTFHECANYLLALTAGLLFISGHTTRLYLFPRAEDMRRKDFFSNAFNVALTTTTTSGYYNTDLSAPIKRAASQALENSLFSKTIVRKMLRAERIKSIVCISVLLVTVTFQLSDFTGIVAQFVIGEQVLSKWLKLEWLRTRFERTYDSLYQLLQTSASTGIFTAHVLDALVTYETTKATGGVILSSRIFELENASISAQWEGVKRALKL